MIGGKSDPISLFNFFDHADFIDQKRITISGLNSHGEFLYVLQGLGRQGLTSGCFELIEGQVAIKKLPRLCVLSWFYCLNILGTAIYQHEAVVPPDIR